MVLSSSFCYLLFSYSTLTADDLLPSLGNLLNVITHMTIKAIKAQHTPTISIINFHGIII